MLRLIMLFLFVLGPRLQPLDLHVVATVVLAGFGLFVGTTQRYEITNYRWLLVGTVPIAIWGLLCSILGGGADFTIASSFVKWVVYLLAAFGVVFLYSRHQTVREAEASLLRDTFIISAVNAAFVIAFVVSPDVRTFAMGVLDLEGKDHWVELGFRGADLSIGGGATASVYFATVSLIALRHASSFRSGLIAGSCFVLLALATLLSGRTGALILVALGPLAIGLAVLRPIQLRISKYAALMGPVICVSTLLVLVVVLVHRESPLVDHFVNIVMPWALEGTGLVPHAAGGNQSVITVIEEMFFLPISDVSLIFGTSNTGRSEWLPYIASDVGYVRVIFGVGLVGLILVIMAFLPLVGIAFEHSQRSTLAFGVGISLLVAVIVNLKELTLVSRGNAPLLAVLAVSLACLHELATRKRLSKVVSRRSASPTQRG